MHCKPDILQIIPGGAICVTANARTRPSGVNPARPPVWCPENSQRASGRVDVSIMRLARNREHGVYLLHTFLFSQFPLPTLLLILWMRRNKGSIYIATKRVSIRCLSSPTRHLRCVLNKALWLPLHIFCVTSGLLHAPTRHHSSPKVYRVSPICVNTSDAAPLWLCGASVKGHLRIMSWPDSPEMIRGSYAKCLLRLLW